MLDFRGADTVRQAGKGAMRRGMRVAADDGHAGQCRTVFRANDVHDALLRVFKREIGQRADFANIAIQRFNLLTGNRVFDALFPMIGRRIVVSRRNNGGNPPRLAASQLEAFKSLRAGHFVNEVAVNIEERRAICFLMDNVVLPKLVVKGLRHGV